jgi:hypothetical protein
MGYMGKPIGRRPSGRPTYRWEDNIKDFLEMRVECDGMDYIRLAESIGQWSTLVNTVMKLGIQ